MVWVLLVLGHCTVTTCVSYNSHATTTKHAAAALTMAQQPHHEESVLAAFFGQLMLIATHPLIGHNLPYWPMHGNWHGWSKWPPKDICTSSKSRPLGTASLSCTKYKKLLHFNNICYFRTRFYIIIKIY